MIEQREATGAGKSGDDKHFKTFAGSYGRDRDQGRHGDGRRWRGVTGRARMMMCGKGRVVGMWISWAALACCVPLFMWAVIPAATVTGAVAKFFGIWAAMMIVFGAVGGLTTWGKKRYWQWNDFYNNIMPGLMFGSTLLFGFGFLVVVVRLLS